MNPSCLYFLLDVPNSGRGLPRLDYRTKKWDVDFRNYLKQLDATKPVVLCGDLNVAHHEIGNLSSRSTFFVAFSIIHRQMPYVCVCTFSVAKCTKNMCMW